MASSHRSTRTSRVAPTGRVALAEHEVHHPQHPRHPVGQLGRGRDPVGDAGRGDLALGPDQSLGHGRLRHPEGAGHLGRAQAGHHAQGQGDVGLGGQGRVAAGEHQPQPVVGHGPGSGVAGAELVVGVGPLGQPGLAHLLALVAGGLASASVDGLAAGRGHQPTAGVGGHALGGPALDGGGEGLGRRLLGQIQVAPRASQAGHHLGPLPAIDLDQLGIVGGPDRHRRLSRPARSAGPGRSPRRARGAPRGGRCGPPGSAGPRPGRRPGRRPR